ncbi:MAG: histidine phosphatase family protein [Erysipelotrichaceae bacterium]|nr:histidine phosphatase family protein [Erysipelotrichaceae bacterium]
MRILFVRHCEPDYQHDSLTPRGIREAEALREYLKDQDLGDIYVSPLGRAQLTAQIALEGSGRRAETLDWLREANVTIDLDSDPGLREFYPDITAKEIDTDRCFWDVMPRKFWEDHYCWDNANWRQARVCASSNLISVYDYVSSSLDDLLAGHGYRRNGLSYEVTRGNHDTITLFCHLGVTGVMLAHLNNLSPFLIPQLTCCAPGSLSECVSEEREKGIAMFRTLYLGATPHLTLADQQPSFSARFAECYEDETRH